jgi:hypothetical protein
LDDFIVKFELIYLHGESSHINISTMSQFRLIFSSSIDGKKNMAYNTYTNRERKL